MNVFSDEESILHEMMRKLCREKVAGRAAEVDVTKEYPWDLHKLFVENGLFNMRVPAEYGGAAMDYASACMGGCP